MTDKFKFSTLPQHSGTVANVFIHGYSAGHDIEDRRKLTKSIPSSLHNCINIFAFWPSSHITRVNGTSKQTILALMKANAYVGAAAIAVDRVAHFLRIRSRATDMGKVLLKQLDQYLIEHHPYVTTVNLVGHSLGGRVLVSALKELVNDSTYKSFTVGDVLLMAAAVELSEQDAKMIDDRIEGRLINAYSDADNVLLMNIGETCIGRNEVPNCENLKMADFGHSDYWPHLNKVLRSTRFFGYEGGLPARPPHNDSAEEYDPVTGDSILFDLLDMTSRETLDQAVKHLKSSSWAGVEEENRVYSLTQELQLLAGHCLANLARGSGLRYMQTLIMLAEHFDLERELHDCVRVVDLEALLVSQFFKSSFTESHVLASKSQVIQQTKSMSAHQYFEQVDALATSLTLASYISSPATPEPEYRKTGTGLAAHATTAVSPLGLLADLLPMTRLQTALTNLMSAVKPGYSALIPTVAVIFFARLKLNNEGLM